MKYEWLLRIAGFALGIIVAGCGVKITNKTPDPLTRSADDRYTISALVERDSTAVYSDTIDASVTIDGTQYPMNGNGPGLWTYEYHAPGATSLELSLIHI